MAKRRRPEQPAEAPPAEEPRNPVDRMHALLVAEEEGAEGPEGEFEEEEYREEFEEDYDFEEDEYEQDAAEEELESDDQEDLEEYDADEDVAESEDELHTVVVDGEEVQVPYDELKRGYSRQADYTRKTQRLAEAARQVQAKDQQLDQQQAQYAALLNRLHTHWTELQSGDEPDWDRLKEEDPVRYSIKREEWRERQEQIGAAEEEMQRVQAMRAQREQALRAQRLQRSEVELQKAIPEWAEDPELSAKERREMIDFAVDEYGFTVEELKDVDDHRPILLLRDAWLGRQARRKADELRRNGGKKKRKSPKSARPGSANNRRRRRPKRVAKDARKRLRSTGSDRAAQSVFEHILASEE